MRIAVCLSGQPRTLKYCSESIMNYFGDVDYFCHAWNYNDYKLKEPNKAMQYIREEFSISEIEESLSVFSPKKLLVETKEAMKDNYFSWASLSYSKMRANHLKKLWEIENDFRYDIVVKARYDLVFPHGRSFGISPYVRSSHYAPNHDFFVLHAERAPKEYWGINISDVIYYGTSTVMDVTCDLYWFLKEKFYNTNSKTDSRRLLGPGALMNEYIRTNDLRYIIDNQNLIEVVYRTSAIPLDYKTHFNEIIQKNLEIYR